MARLSSNDRQAASSRYTTSYTTVSLTLADALKYVADGRMQPAEVFGQLPANLRESIDEICRAEHRKTFSGLSLVEQKRVLAEAFSEPKGAMTLLEALTKVVEGEMAPVDLFNQLPTDLCEEVDQRCKSISGKGFRSLSVEEQRMVCASLLSSGKRPQKRNSKDSDGKRLPTAAGARSSKSEHNADHSGISGDDRAQSASSSSATKREIPGLNASEIVDRMPKTPSSNVITDPGLIRLLDEFHHGSARPRAVDASALRIGPVPELEAIRDTQSKRWWQLWRR